MHIERRRLAGIDGVEHPLFDASVDAPGGVRLALSLLVDTGTDLTVLAPAVAHQLAEIVEPTLTHTIAARMWWAAADPRVGG